MMVVPHLTESEYRQPFLTFSVPDWWAENTSVSEPRVYGLFCPSVLFWIELLILVWVSVFFAVLTAAITYHLIIAPKKTDTPTAYLLGYGLFLPFWISWPHFTVKILDNRNLVFKFIVGNLVPILVKFRLFEAIYGCCPESAMRSMKDFVTHFALILVFERDPKTDALIPATNAMKLKHLRNFVGMVFFVGAYQSVLTAFQDLNVFGKPIEEDGWFAVERLLTWQLYANSFLHAALFQIYLTLYFEGLIFCWLVVTGCQVKKGMHNPLGRATSPSDFWGRRWNILVHTVLKGGVYKPMRKHGYSPLVASAFTFVMSGVFHEWLIYGILGTSCYTYPTGPSCYRPFYGGATVFFLWQAVLVAFEYLSRGTPLVLWASHNLSPYAKTLIIIGLGLPVAHFFSEPYVRSNFFYHGQMALPVILSISQH